MSLYTMCVPRSVSTKGVQTTVHPRSALLTASPLLEEMKWLQNTKQD